MADDAESLVLKAVLRDCGEDILTSDLNVRPLAAHLMGTGHFTEEENQTVHDPEDAEDARQKFLDVFETKKDAALDAMLDYLEIVKSKQPHLYRILVAARARRRINPYDDDDEDEDKLAEGDFWLKPGGIEIIRNVVMASPTAKGKWLDIALHIVGAPSQVAKLKSVDAGRPEKMIDMSLEFWIKGTDSQYKPTFLTLLQVLEMKKNKKLAEALSVEKVKGKLEAACQ